MIEFASKQGMRRQLQQERGRHAELAARLREHSPAQSLRRSSDRLIGLTQRLQSATRAHGLATRNRVALAARALDAVSPLATLNRGYAIVSDAATGAIISHVRETRAGRAIRAQLADGSLSAEIKSVTPGEKK